MNTAIFSDLTNRFGNNFQQWMEQQDLSDREKVVWMFHYYERYGTSLKSGSIVDYRKYAAQYINESGELLESLENLGSHERAAINKFREADNANLKSISTSFAKTNATGEN